MTLQPGGIGIPFFSFIEDGKTRNMGYPFRVAGTVQYVGCYILHSHKQHQLIIWLYPILKGTTQIDAPVLILGCEMELHSFHYHSLVPIMSADSYLRLPNK